MAEEIKAQIKAVISERGMVEREVELITSRLDSSLVSSTGSLLDKDGYPRSDIDVHAVRTDRHRLILLTNDHKALTSRIEKLMHALHAASSPDASHQKPTPAGNNPAIDHEVSASISMPSSTPFALIDAISEGSPSSTCFLVGDRVLQIGTVSRLSSHDQSGRELLVAASQVIAGSEGEEVVVKIIREGRELTVTIRPQRWSGRGLLGCNFQPI